MLIISNQILIDLIRLNQKAKDIRNQELGKQLDEIIIGLGGTQRGEIPNGRDNQEGNAFGFPKTSMTYNFPESHLANLFRNIFSQIK